VLDNLREKFGRRTLARGNKLRSCYSAMIVLQSGILVLCRRDLV